MSFLPPEKNHMRIAIHILLLIRLNIRVGQSVQSVSLPGCWLFAVAGIADEEIVTSIRLFTAPIVFLKRDFARSTQARKVFLILFHAKEKTSNHTGYN